ncbi:unnamed protein product, partial [Porites lobata]
MDDSECLSEFRFHKSDLSILSEALHLPNYFICQQGTICDGIEGLCTALRRFAYPCRLSDLIPRFVRPVPELSMISSLVVDTIYREHNHRITQWNDILLNLALLETYARAIQQNGSPLHNCFGFIDGTVRPICRPDQNQRIVYNGHKRMHGLKYHSVALPNGMIANMFGPVEGRKHDSAMLADSGLLQDLEQHAFSTTREPMALYGDPAYPLRVYLQVPYRGVGITPQMELYNKAMSSVRMSVEWDVLNYFKFLDFKKNLKISLSADGKMYIVAAILRNALTCMYGNLLRSILLWTLLLFTIILLDQEHKTSSV